LFVIIVNIENTIGLAMVFFVNLSFYNSYSIKHCTQDHSMKISSFVIVAIQVFHDV